MSYLPNNLLHICFNYVHIHRPFLRKITDGNNYEKSKFNSYSYITVFKKLSLTNLFGNIFGHKSIEFTFSIIS